MSAKLFCPGRHCVTEGLFLGPLYFYSNFASRLIPEQIFTPHGPQHKTRIPSPCHSGCAHPSTFQAQSWPQAFALCVLPGQLFAQSCAWLALPCHSGPRVNITTQEAFLDHPGESSPSLNHSHHLLFSKLGQYMPFVCLSTPHTQAVPVTRHVFLRSQ